MKRSFVTDINKIRYEVNVEVAKAAFANQLDEKETKSLTQLFREIHLPTAAVFIVRGRLSVRECVLQRATVLLPA